MVIGNLFNHNMGNLMVFKRAITFFGWVLCEKWKTLVRNYNKVVGVKNPWNLSCLLDSKEELHIYDRDTCKSCGSRIDASNNRCVSPSFISNSWKKTSAMSCTDQPFQHFKLFNLTTRMYTIYTLVSKVVWGTNHSFSQRMASPKEYQHEAKLDRL